MTSYADYKKAVLDSLWTWANRTHPGALDRGKRQGRPPVLAKGFESKNVLVPPDESRAAEIRAAIPRKQQHRWFRSLKSSQALAQSVSCLLLRVHRLGGMFSLCLA